MRRHTRQFHVLVCDDDKACRLSVVEVLRREGLMTFEAGGGYEAIRLARKVQVDFGFFDYALPDLDGPSAVKQIRQESISFPFVLMSGQELVLEQLEAEAGPIAFLPKPLDLAAIRRIVQKFSSAP